MNDFNDTPMAASSMKATLSGASIQAVPPTAELLRVEILDELTRCYESLAVLEGSISHALSTEQDSKEDVNVRTPYEIESGYHDYLYTVLKRAQSLNERINNVRSRVTL